MSQTRPGTGRLRLPLLRLPVVAAPMFLISGPELVAAVCEAGAVGTMPALNGRRPEDFVRHLDVIAERLDRWQERHPGAARPPYGINLSLRLADTPRFQQDLAACEARQVPIVITSVGNPAPIVPRVHGWGGLVWHDVVTIEHARKAADAGVDGIIFVCAGAGGHSGRISPFAVVPQLRRFFDGAIGLAGAIGDGRAIRAAEILGADLVYMGTRFIATQESLAPDAYKRLMLAEGTRDVVHTDSFTGMHANYLAGSIRAAGLDPADLPRPKGLWQPDLPPGVRPWRDIWSAGHGVGLIDDIPDVATLMRRLVDEYEAAG